ncbi:hypothetical protein GCM10010912_24930 [Paenibacillus albidus]|uniref:Uncharacterized protein n=1 Tax=Paenibacillus albidus TaxID=2041023 RepID=A0A917CA95_9BACL|nr:hypothetical protein GCM10010912_24930 [Paenibacillus albidus]
MQNVLRLVGILFSVSTLILAITFLWGEDQSRVVRLSWAMLGMSGALIFNGGATYLNTKDKMGALSSVVGFILMIVTLTQSPF